GTSGTRRSTHLMPIIAPAPRHIVAGQQLAVAGGPGVPARLAAPHLGEVEAVGGVDAATGCCDRVEEAGVLPPGDVLEGVGAQHLAAGGDVRPHHPVGDAVLHSLDVTHRSVLACSVHCGGVCDDK